MPRYLLTAVTVLLFAASAHGQEWARKMFETTSHDFGTVARGAKAEFHFKLSNIYKEDIHIASVRSSCGCTAPSITKPLLKTYEDGSILAVFNTRSFYGARRATITVTIDRPYPAEVQLTVNGYIRSDVVFTPASVQFGSISQGEAAEKSVSLTYAGRGNWAITDVRASKDYYEVALDETGRAGGRVSYALSVRLKENAPVGYLDDQLVIVTNDAGTTNLPLMVEGRVVSAVTVSPASVFMGALAPGEEATKQLVVRGNRPFKIVGVNCDDCFKVKLPAESKQVHIIPVTYVAGETPGNVSKKIELVTDLGGATASFLATATIE